jgi:hypothetical protein
MFGKEGDQLQNVGSERRKRQMKQERDRKNDKS